MTLALYGKSRRRQGALLTAALLAVIIAAVGALGAITSAFAHHTEYAKSGTCDGWTAHAGYVGGSGKRLVIIENVKIGGTDYQDSWSTGFATGAGTSNGIQAYSGGSIDSKTLSGVPGGVASGPNVKYWFGIDSTDDPSRPSGTSYDWTIFNRSGTWPAGAFSGRILQFTEGTGNDSGKWLYQPGESITSLDAPTRPSNCDRTIRIVKVTEGSGRPSTWSFSGTITNASPTSWTLSNSASSVDYVVPKNKAHTVTETTPGAGWILDGYRILDGKENANDCGTSDNNYGSGNTVSSGTGDKTVCILNEWIGTGQLVLSEGSCVVQDGAAYAKFHFLIPSNANVPESSARTLSGTYNPGSASFGPVSEYSDANSHPDWFFTIPFGSNSSITLLTAQTSDGWTWPTTGAGRDKATVRNDCLPKGTLIVGKVKDPTAGVPAADGSQFSGTATNQGNNAVINWGSITFGGFATLANTPAGTYTVSETGTQNGWTPYGWAAGSLNQQGQPTCPADKASYTAGNPKTNVQVSANQTTVVCVMNTKTAQVPSIDKVKASEGYSGGYAYWDIKVTNPENIAQSVKINDVDVVFVSVSGGTCSDNDFSDNWVTCSVNANSTLVVKVKKQIVTTCQPQAVRNVATIYRIPPTGGDPVLIGSAGNSDDTEYTIPADPAKCDKPGITKTLVQNGSSQTTDPNAIAWLVTVTNPATGSNGTTQTVYIKDQNVTVVGTPALSGGALCVMPVGSSFEQELNGASGVQCSMPNSSSITFTVKPKPAPQRTCQDQVFTNTASLYMSSGELVALIGEASSTITLLGNPDLCTTTIKICKVVEDNGDGYTRPAGTFVLTVTASSQTTQHAINAAEGGGRACEDVTVPANATIITVGEAATRPTGWNGDAQGYPKISGPDNSGTYTVTNKEKVVKNVTFSKYICNTFGDVPRNEGPGGQDDTGKNAYAGGLNSLLGGKGPSGDNDPVTPSNDNRGSSCKLATTPWTFNLWTNARSNGSGGTLLQAVTVTGSQSVQLDDSVINELIAGRNVYVEEVYQSGYAFGALKCYTDHLNDDNWEWIDPSALQEQGAIHCIAYNVPVKTITIQKVWVGDSEITKDDYPIFTLEGFPFDKACTGPQLSSPSGTPPVVTGTWTCTVPVGWNGKVTEVPAAGWKQCDMPNGNGNGTFSAQTEAYGFTNCKLGKIIVHKVYPQGTPTDSATFSGTISNNSNTYNWGPLMVNGSYTIENVVPGPYDVSETLPSGYELVGIYSATSSTNPGAAIACGAQTSLVADVPDSPDIMVNPGETLHVWVCNRPLGTVVIVKYENVPPATAQTWTFTGNSPILSQSLSTTGTTNSVGTASTTILNVPAGSYTVAETQGRGRCETGTTSSDWETRGLVQVGGSLPTAGDVNSADIIGSGSLNVPVKAGTTTYVVFGNIGCGSVLSAANLQVNKFSDPLANFTGTTPLGGWTITITGTAGTAAGFTATQQTNGAGQAFFLGIPDGTYTVCETLQSGWANVGSKYNTVTQAGLCRTGVTVNLNQTATVDFYNQPRVTIRVHKTLNVVGFTSNGQGWQFTLTGCGITPQTKTTDANGIADFTDLPPAISCVYTVTETVQPGWTPQFVSQTAQPVAGGQVVRLEFLNIKDFNPPCTDPNDPRCVPPPPPSTPTPTPTGTPTTPTVTTTPPPTATPTNTPTPTPTNTPVTQVAGEKTPGPGASPTPLAPSTGYGFGGAQGGMSLLLVLAGLISLSLGLGFIALGRRTNR